jgi:hypothetical protein
MDTKSTSLRGSVQSPSWVCLKVHLHALLAMAAFGTAGCGTDPGVPIEKTATTTQALGGNWRAFQQLPTQSGGFNGSPAVCNAFNNAGAFVAFGRSTSTSRFRFSLSERIFPATAWADMGTQTFSSKPACAVLDDLYFNPPHCYKKVVVGRAASGTWANRYLIRTMRILPGPTDPETNLPLPATPEMMTNWNPIGTDTWSTAPAAAVGGGALTVCGRKSDNRVWCKASLLDPEDSDFPYTGSWLAAVQAPALPSPWAAQGDPAIANTEPWLATMTVAVRATRSFPSQTRLFSISFDPDSGTFGGWWQFPTGTLGISSDPAMDVDKTRGWFDGATIFFRGTDNRIYEASGTANLGWSPFSAINAANDTNTGWSGPPGAAGSLDGWEGFHAVVAPKNGQFHVSSPCPVEGGC